MSSTFSGVDKAHFGGCQPKFSDKEDFLQTKCGADLRFSAVHSANEVYPVQLITGRHGQLKASTLENQMVRGVKIIGGWESFYPSTDFRR